MKMFLLSALVAVAAVSGAVGYQTYQSNKSTLSELGMANIDALTNGEGVTRYQCLGTAGECIKGYDLTTGEFWSIAGLKVVISNQ